MADRKGSGSKGSSSKGSSSKGSAKAPRTPARGAPAMASSPRTSRAGGGTGVRRGAQGLPPVPVGPREVPRLRVKYDGEIRPELVKEFGYRSVMQAPGLHKVVINIGMGEALTNANAMAAAVGDLETIVGQKVVITKAKRSISQFKLRQGQSIGCMVTLRGARMFDFLDKLFNVALPRVRDFRGLPPKGFDGNGNYNMGLKEQIVFPEINYDKIDKVRGMNITICTTAKNDVQGKALLEALGVPFRK